ncbi:unnamed protein product [Calypogeia fissa]
MAFPFTGRIELAWLVVLQTTYSYYFVLRFRKGLPRLLALLPLLPPSLLVPWRAPTVSERVVLSFLVLWMINTKLLLLAWDLGPAVDPFALSTFPRFFFSIVSSVHLKRDQQLSKEKKTVAKNGTQLKEEDVDDGRTGSSSKWRSSSGRRSAAADENAGRKSSSIHGLDDGRPSGGLVRRKTAAVAADDEDGKVGNPVQARVEKGGIQPLKWVEMVAASRSGPVVLLKSMFYFMVEVALLRMLLAWRHVVSIYVLDFMLTWYLYFGCLFLFESAAAIPACLFGTEVEPQFNLPMLADSLADFWGRRWNLLVNNLLRVSVHEPTLKLLNGTTTEPTPWARVVPTLASFLVSGLMHDVICFYGGKLWPTWELTAFFVLNGIGTIIEGFVLPPRRRSQIPRLLRRAYTLTFLYFTTYWLFYPPTVRSGLVDALAEVGQFIDWIQGPIVRCFSS